MANDHRDHYGLGYSADELKRLEYQHGIWHEDNQFFLKKAGFKAGDTLVDLGCGPGYTTLDLAQRVGPKGRVLAVDRDGERSLPRLKKQAQDEGLKHIEVMAADLLSFDLKDKSVDGVYARWVLIHVPESKVEKIVNRIAGWLRPGASCLLVEYCNYRHIHIHPPSVHLPQLTETIIRTAKHNTGSNPEIGNVLPGLLYKAGLEVDVHVVVKTARAMTPEWQWPDDLFRNQLPSLVEQGYITRAVFEAFLNEWDERSNDPGALFFGWPVMFVNAKKPPIE